MINVLTLYKHKQLVQYSQAQNIKKMMVTDKILSDSRNTQLCSYIIYREIPIKL